MAVLSLPMSEDTMESLTPAEQRLAARLTEEHRALYNRLTRRMETYLLDFAAMHIRYFTNHGRKHFLGVIQQMSEMLPDDVLAGMSSTEALILLCCAWLHDIGLMVNVDHHTGKSLSDDEIRDRHAELGRDLIRAEYRSFGLEDRVLAGLVADVGYCHSRAAKPPIQEYLEARDVLGGDVVRPQFLAALVRLADALDTDSRRAPESLAQLLKKLSPGIEVAMADPITYQEASTYAQTVTYQTRLFIVTTHAD